MDQKIILDPALGFTTGQLAAAWNANSTITAKYGPARVEAASPSQFNDPFVEMGFLIVSSITLNLFSSIIYDLLKDALIGRRKPTVQLMDQPDGSQIWIVVIEE